MWKRICFGSVNCFGIGCCPFTDFLKHFFFEIHYTSITFRTDIQQVISPAADYFHQTSDFLIHFLFHTSSFLPGTVPPGFVKHRSSSLPRHTYFVVGIFIVSHYAEIHVVIAQSSTNHAFWLQAIDQFIQSFALSGRKRTHVKPDFRNRSVIAHDFFHLMQVELVMFGSQWIGIVARNGVGLRKMPVDKRKIDRKINSSALAGFGQFFHQVAFVRS